MSTTQTMGDSSGTTTASAARFFLIQVVGGLGVLGSYAAGLAAHPGSDALYGSMPQAIRSFYSVTMISAAVGYFPMMVFLFRHRDAVRLGSARGPGLVDGLFAAMLLPSIAWMPATFAYLDGGSASAPLWWIARGVLVIVAFASYGLVAAIASVRPSSASRTLALIGACAFTLQTGLLDPYVWPLFMPASLLP